MIIYDVVEISKGENPDEFSYGFFLSLKAARAKANYVFNRMSEHNLKRCYLEVRSYNVSADVVAYFITDDSLREYLVVNNAEYMVDMLR